MGFSFSTIEPNQLGQVTKWDVPLADWMGIKFQNGNADTLGTAVSRATEDFIWDDDNPAKPEVLNSAYGIPGHLNFDKPMSIQRARLMHERKRGELERLAYVESASHSWASAKAVVGFGATLVGGLSHPLDLGLAFLPFIGSEKAAADVAKLGGSAWRQALARGVITEEALIANRVPYARLTGAVVDGIVNQAVAEIPIAIQKHRDQAIYGLEDSAFNILAGGAFSGAVKGLGLALERASRLWRELDPKMREAALFDTARTILTGDPPRAHWAFGMDEATIRAKVEEKARVENPFDEAGVLAKVPPGKTLEPATAGELVAALNRGEFAEWITPSDAAIVNRLIDRVKAGERSPELFDTIAAYVGKSYDASGSIRSLRQELGRVVDAITKSEVLLDSSVPAVRQQIQENIAKLEQRRNQIADDIARTESGLQQREFAKGPVREQSINDFLTRSKADYEARIKNLVDEETQRVINEVKRQTPPLPKEQAARYTFKSVPDDANIKAVEEDATGLEAEVLNRAATPEQRQALEAEIKASLKELDEKAVSGEKAADEMLPCVVARSKS